MKLKMLLLAGVIIGLLAVPLAAAAPSFGQGKTQNGDTLQLQDKQQLQTQDCLNAADDSVEPLQSQDQNQTQTQDQQQLRTRDCNCTDACGGDCNQTQTQQQTRTCLQQQAGVQSSTGYGSGEQTCNCYAYIHAHQNRQGNKTP
ncbi:MAG: hypothetical protein ACBZ72_01520 [Candidatus Bathyarchaeia archaeon]|jgi:hypothetical protein